MSQGAPLANVVVVSATGGLHYMGLIFIAQHTVSTKTVFEKHKNTISDPELASFPVDLQKAWYLN